MCNPPIYVDKPKISSKPKKSNLLEGVADDPKKLESLVKLLEIQCKFPLSKREKKLVSQAIESIVATNKEATLLECLKKWEEIPSLDKWNQQFRKYFIG